MGHRWLKGPAQALHLANAIRAARAAFPNLVRTHGPFVVMGHSQGAGAALSFVETQVSKPITGYDDAYLVRQMENILILVHGCFMTNTSFLTTLRPISSSSWVDRGSHCSSAKRSEKGLEEKGSKVSGWYCQARRTWWNEPLPDHPGTCTQIRLPSTSPACENRITIHLGRGILHQMSTTPSSTKMLYHELVLRTNA